MKKAIHNNGTAAAINCILDEFNFSDKSKRNGCRENESARIRVSVDHDDECCRLFAFDHKGKNILAYEIDWNWTIANGGFVYELGSGEYLATFAVRFDLPLVGVSSNTRMGFNGEISKAT